MWHNPLCDADGCRMVAGAKNGFTGDRESYNQKK